MPSKCPQVGETYRHYKGDYYRVKCIALHSNDEEWMVVYEPLYDTPDAPFFTRPLSEWYELCDWEDAHEKVQRFTLITP